MTEGTNNGWHIAKSVPATLLLGLITQAGAIVWTVSMMMSDIDRNAAAIRSMDGRVDKIEDMVQAQAIAMARIDENIKAIRGAVEQMASRK